MVPPPRERARRAASLDGPGSGGGAPRALSPPPLPPRLASPASRSPRTSLWTMSRYRGGWGARAARGSPDPLGAAPGRCSGRPFLSRLGGRCRRFGSSQGPDPAVGPGEKDLSTPPPDPGPRPPVRRTRSRACGRGARLNFSCLSCKSSGRHVSADLGRELLRVRLVLGSLGLRLLIYSTARPPFFAPRLISRRGVVSAPRDRVLGSVCTRGAALSPLRAPVFGFGAARAPGVGGLGWAGGRTCWRRARRQLPPTPPTHTRRKGGGAGARCGARSPVKC